MTRCKRCGTTFELRNVGDRYCQPCNREVAARLAPTAQPAWLPTWRRAPFAKELTA